jgi:HSP20 family protein
MSAEMATKEPHANVERVERARSGWTFVPCVDIIEKKDELLLVADLPGAKPEAIDVNYERGVLTIDAPAPPRQDEQQVSFLLREYGVGDYHRSFQIGEGIDAGRIHAEFRSGVLNLHLPKAESFKPRKIEVKTR